MITFANHVTNQRLWLVEQIADAFQNELHHALLARPVRDEQAYLELIGRQATALFSFANSARNNFSVSDWFWLEKMRMPVLRRQQETARRISR